MRKRIAPSAVLWLLVGAAYFLLPLLAMLIFSLRSGTTGKCCTSANYREIVDDPEFWRSLRQSFVLSIETIIVSLTLLIPTVYWVHLKLPRLRSLIGFLALIPFVETGPGQDSDCGQLMQRVKSEGVKTGEKKAGK